MFFQNSWRFADPVVYVVLIKSTERNVLLLVGNALTLVLNPYPGRKILPQNARREKGFTKFIKFRSA